MPGCSLSAIFSCSECKSKPNGNASTDRYILLIYWHCRRGIVQLCVHQWKQNWTDKHSAHILLENNSNQIENERCDNILCVCVCRMKIIWIYMAIKCMYAFISLTKRCKWLLVLRNHKTNKMLRSVWIRYGRVYRLTGPVESDDILSSHRGAIKNQERK